MGVYIQAHTGTPAFATVSDMIGAMHFRHRLAALIWAALLVVAAQFVAGSAFAHSGHAHDHHASAVPTAAAHSSAGRAQQHATPSDEILLGRQQKTDVVVTAFERSHESAFNPSGGCTGGCCGTGIGCCGAVLQGSLIPLPDFRAAKDIVLAVFERGSGIDPEASARPPRTLA